MTTASTEVIAYVGGYPFVKAMWKADSYFQERGPLIRRLAGYANVDPGKAAPAKFRTAAPDRILLARERKFFDADAFSDADASCCCVQVTRAPCFA